MVCQHFFFLYAYSETDGGGGQASQLKTPLIAADADVQPLQVQVAVRPGIKTYATLNVLM